jgi:hypothetical protein
VRSAVKTKNKKQKTKNKKQKTKNKKKVFRVSGFFVRGLGGYSVTQSEYEILNLHVEGILLTFKYSDLSSKQ